MTIYYVAIIDHDIESGSWGVWFPDFPGCVSAADSYQGVLASGTEALGSHIALMRKEGDAIPAPRDLEDIRAAEPDIDWSTSIAALIPALPSSGRKARINATLDEALLARIDEVTTNRSAFLEEAARKALGLTESQ